MARKLLRTYMYMYMYNYSIHINTIGGWNINFCFFATQNLVRHLKFVEDESQQMAYDDQKLSVTQFRAELERWVR